MYMHVLGYVWVSAGDGQSSGHTSGPNACDVDSLSRWDITVVHNGTNKVDDRIDCMIKEEHSYADVPE